MTSKGALGACLSDLVAQIYALVTENEKGDLLAQRILEINATLSAISKHAYEFAKDKI